MAFDVEARTIDIIAQKAGVLPGTLRLETRLKEDLGFDSLDFVELVGDLEEEFGVPFPDADERKLRTVRDVLELALNTVGERP